jgi:hypothetical protein
MKSKPPNWAIRNCSDPEDGRSRSAPMASAFASIQPQS